MGWFDEDEHVDGNAAEDFEESSAAFDGEDDLAAEDDFDDYTDSSPSPRRSGWGSRIAIPLGIAVLVGLGVFGGVKMLSFGSEEEPPEVVASSTPSPSVSVLETPTPVTTTPTEEARCPNQVAADDRTPDGVVVAFQEAYYSGDVAGVKERVAPGSYLERTDWPTLLTGLEGTEFCVKTTVTTDSTVDADVTVRSTDDEAMFLQTYTVKKVADQYKIVAIDDREDRNA